MWQTARNNYEVKLLHVSLSKQEYTYVSSNLYKLDMQKKIIEFSLTFGRGLFSFI